MHCDWLKGKTQFKRRYSFERRLKRHKTIRFENDTKTPFWTKKNKNCVATVKYDNTAQPLMLRVA